MEQYWDFLGETRYLVCIIAVVAVAFITAIIQGIVNHTYNKCSQIPNSSEVSGEEAARRILQAEGITDVDVQMTDEESEDRYKPRRKALLLTPAVYGSISVYALGIAAHEAVHVIRRKGRNLSARFFGAIMPAVKFISGFSLLILIAGVIMRGAWRQDVGDYTMLAGIALFVLSILITLFDLPVEISANRKALRLLADAVPMNEEDIKAVKRVFRAAALAGIGSLSEFLVFLFKILASKRG